MKKSILLLFLAFLALYSCNQAPENSFTLSGDIQGLKDPFIYFQWKNSSDSARTDSAKVTSGKFTFNGKVTHPEMALIYTKNFRGYVQFFLENADIHITGNADSLSNAKITGSASQDQYASYIASVKSLNDQEDSLYTQYKAAQKNNDSATIVLAENKMNGLDSQINQQTKVFITKNPTSYVSLYQLQSLSYSTEYPEMEKLFTGLDTSLQNSSMGQKLARNLVIMKKTAIGQPALAFTQESTEGKPVSLSDFKGKYVLIDFWASWCGPCRAENPNVVKAYNQYKNKNFTILGVSLDKDSSAWKQAIVHDHLTWTEVSDLKGWKNAAAQEYGVNAIPANFLVNPDGIIIGHNLRGEALENKLASVLQ